MKKVQIDYELFRKLIFYHLGSDDQYEEDIRNGLEEKLDAYIVELSSEMEQCIPAVNDVESYVDGVEIGRVISTFLRKQPKEKRIIFMHRYYYCDTVLSIAKRFGYSESKVKIMLYRMRKDLRVYLTKEGYFL